MLLIWICNPLDMVYNTLFHTLDRALIQGEASRFSFQPMTTAITLPVYASLKLRPPTQFYYFEVKVLSASVTELVLEAVGLLLDLSSINKLKHYNHKSSEEKKEDFLFEQIMRQRGITSEQSRSVKLYCCFYPQ